MPSDRRVAGPPRHSRPQPGHRGPRRILTGLALLVGAAVSAWIVVSPTHADGLPGRLAAATTIRHAPPASPTASPHPASAPATPATATAPTASSPAATATATGGAYLPWRYQDKCPEKALACVDLAHKVSWLQANGVVIYGPVRIEPGSPGQATPTGVFTVSWKDKHHVSNEFDEAMPDAIFFAPGGIAFHVGSLTKGSHGCVHMTTRDANYYWDQLQVGATVAVF